MIIFMGCSQNAAPRTLPEPCSENWLELVESKLGTGDGQGHGPDIGSMEWRSVIEFKLGLRGSNALPERGSKEWCDYIDRHTFKNAT